MFNLGCSRPWTSKAKSGCSSLKWAPMSPCHHEVGVVLLYQSLSLQLCWASLPSLLRHESPSISELSKRLSSISWWYMAAQWRLLLECLYTLGHQQVIWAPQEPLRMGSLFLSCVKYLNRMSAVSSAPAIMEVSHARRVVHFALAATGWLTYCRTLALFTSSLWQVAYFGGGARGHFFHWTSSTRSRCAAEKLAHLLARFCHVA